MTTQIEKALALAEDLVEVLRGSPPVFDAFGGEAFMRAPPLARRMIVKYWPVDQWETAAAIGELESSWDAHAINDTRDRTDLPEGHVQEFSIGWYQINMLVHSQHKLVDLKDPEYNARAAYALWHRFGWKPWSAAKKLGVT